MKHKTKVGNSIPSSDRNLGAGDRSHRKTVTENRQLATETRDPRLKTQDAHGSAFANGKKPPLTHNEDSTKLFTWEVLRAHEKGQDILPSIHWILDVLQPERAQSIEPRDAANLRKAVMDYIKKNETADQTIRVLIDYLELDYEGTRDYGIATGILIEAAEREETQGRILAGLAEVIDHGVKPSAKNASIAALCELLDKGVDIRDTLFRLTWVFTHDDEYNIRTNALDLWEAAAEKLDLSPLIPTLIKQGSDGPQTGSPHINRTFPFLAFLAGKEHYRKEIMDEFMARWKIRHASSETFFHAAIRQGIDISPMINDWIDCLVTKPETSHNQTAFQLLKDAAQKCGKSTRDAIATALFKIIKSKQFAIETELNTRYYEQLVTRIARIMAAITIGEIIDNLEAGKQATEESK